MKNFSLPKLMSFCALCVGLFLLGKNLLMLTTGERVNGVVIELKEKIDRKNRRTYYPLVHFKLENGKPHQIAIKRQSMNRVFHKVGDKIPLMYFKNNLNSLQQATFFWIYGFPLIFIVVGIILFFMSGFEYRYSKSLDY